MAAYPNVSSIVLTFGDAAYYMSPEPTGRFLLEGSKLIEPCTVITAHTDTVTKEFLEDTIARFDRSDDVWSSSFLRTIVVQSSTTDAPLLHTDAELLVKERGTESIHYIHRSSNEALVPEGPYFTNAGRLHSCYLLYPDTHGAFIVSTIQSSDPFLYKSLDASAWGEKYPSALTIAVPSRLYTKPTTDRPLAGLRIAVKDNIDLRGLRTGVSSRAFTELYGPKEESAVTLQNLLDLGAIVVGKTKSTQFCDTEWATADWVDYHAPINPRADGYQGPSGSSAGSGAAMAAYEWLDWALGSDSKHIKDDLAETLTLGLAAGSLRSPATVQGLFTMRPSLGMVNMKGVIPYSRKFDTLGGFTRDVHSFLNLAKALYSSGSTHKCSKRPSKILIPTEYWPVANKETEAVYERFIMKLEGFLRVKRTYISLEKIWTEKAGIEQPIGQYLNQTFVNIYTADQWQLYKDFAAEYKEKFGRPPVLNPEGQFKMDFLPTTTKKELQDKGLREQSIYKAWFDKHIITTDEEGCSNALFLTPWSSGEPDYRDTYRERPSWIGDEFRYWFVCPYAEAPEMIIPIGQTPYVSRVTHQQEWLPVVIGVMSAKGSDINLVELIKDMMIETGMETQVKAGRTPFRVRGDHESSLKQEDGQRPLHLYDSSG